MLIDSCWSWWTMTSSEDTSFDCDDEMITWNMLPLTPASLEQLTIDELCYLDSDNDLCKGTVPRLVVIISDGARIATWGRRPWTYGSVTYIRFSLCYSFVQISPYTVLCIIRTNDKRKCYSRIIVKNLAV